MIHSSPAKVILIGISLDLRDSAELVSWAIQTLAQPNDTVVALHVLVAEGMKKRVDQKREEIKKWKSITKYQTQIRQAKAFVINVMGEFARTCQSKQVNLEAKVAFSSSVGKGLIEEAKGISAEFLLIGSSKNSSNKVSHETTRYCFEDAPEGCSIVLVGKSKPPQQDFHSNSIHFKEFRMASSSWSNKKNNTTKSNKSMKMRDQRPSPKTVLDLIEAESQSTTEEFNSSTSSGESTSMAPSPFPLKGKSNFKKRMSPLKILSSFFSNGRKGNDGEFSKKGKQRPLLRCFSYQELAIATNNFHQDNIVGRGGYSVVYRGDLENGHEIAVKRLAKDNKDENKEKEFLVELGIIGHVNHPNTASLVGYCFENGLYLIFNYYSNGTLSSALHGKTGKSMEWGMRYKIAVGIARGLHYLHKCCKHRIIHRDIKASNVLLGPDFEPQISDFGLAKWLPSKWTHHAAIPIEGTFGYLAPEYFVNGIVDEKTDVFAFGILLLEIITGRRPVDSSKQSLLLWAKPLMESEKIEELADPNLEGKYETEQMHRLVLTASYCVRQSSIWRPSMTEVLQLLTYGEGFEMGESWRLQESVTEEIDDYSMIFGYDLPSDIALEDL